MFVECRHIKPRGTKCGSPALKGRPYCYYHDQLHTYTQDGRRDDNDKTFCLPSIEDASGIQLALTQVMNAMANHRLDSREGVRLIYGLQVALQALAQVAPAAPQEIVHDTSCDGIGVDLANDDAGPGEPHPECRACVNRFSCQNIARQNKKSFRNLIDESRDRRERAGREPLALPAAGKSAALNPAEQEPPESDPALVRGEEGTGSRVSSSCPGWELDPFRPQTESLDPEKEAALEARIKKFMPDKKEADRIARIEEIHRMEHASEITFAQMNDLLDHPELPLPSSRRRRSEKNE
jgi:hypothetical protein